MIALYTYIYALCLEFNFQAKVSIIHSLLACRVLHLREQELSQYVDCVCVQPAKSFVEMYSATGDQCQDNLYAEVSFFLLI